MDVLSRRKEQGKKMAYSFRDLTAEDIEVRVQSVKPNGVVLLLYKNARVDMAILDETVGTMNWQRSHEVINGNLYCNVGIYYPETKGWVWKQDCGTESNTEKEKGERSDAFKRRCFNWGIGRELYTAPFIWVAADKCDIKDGKCFDKFCIEKIRIENKRITGISVYNTTQKKRVFVWQKGEK